MGHLNELSEGVYRTHAPGHTLPPYVGTECYWIGDSREVVLIDTGDGGPAAQSALEDGWRELGEPAVRAIVATHHHDDHSGGGSWGAERFHCPVFMHPRDIERLEERHPGQSSGWERLAAGTWQVGGRSIDVLEAPGHTPGQCNIWIPDTGVLLAGDNVLGNTTSVIIPPEGNLADYLTTLERLQDLKPRILGPGHGDVVSDPVSYLAHYLSHRHQRSQQILALLEEEGGMTRKAVALRIYRGILSEDNLAPGEWMVQGHLEWFMARGVVFHDSGVYRKVDGHDFS